MAGVTDEGQLESLEVTTRYDKQLAFGTAIDDDLGRQWTVTDSRTTEDRRFLVFDCERVVSTGVDFPVILEGEGG